ncbi:hypothetical protein [Corallococcus aberystwythensis]|uniref:Uncharacterized protein n=1 Tax=Corallococcus aberystwythensis TaxID=2316722 RepID=A0A3A8PRN8_9BACT|nr:hypothetical protein [Corallococcus aberystwythensis]RKH59023.1 hypothetical protein D7W81_28005 [Corallococcus aberystwythensis]
MNETHDIPPAPDFNPSRAKAAQDLTVPAILMMVLAGLWALYSLYGMVGSAGTAEQMTAIDTALEQYPPELRDKLSGLVDMMRSPSFRIFSQLPSLVVCGLVILGAWKMKNLQSYGLAMTAAILCCIPCCGPCCGLSLIPGIWSVIVLNRPDVKAAFR